MENRCVFTYYITEEKVAIPELPVEKEFGKYTILMDNNTPFSVAFNGENACAIFGVAVNVLSGDSSNLVKWIVDNCKDVHDVVEYERHLGGKYVLLFKDKEQYYMQGDATCSVPICYDTEGPFACSSNDQYIVGKKGYCTDGEYEAIRNSGDISQAMPYDITSYRQVKQLIPNHYLDINKRTHVRFVNARSAQKTISVKEATNIALPMIKNLLDFYLRNFKIYCPITGGRDSRVVLSFLMEGKADFSCYTIKHPEHNENTQDIVVPVALCKKEGIEHALIEDIVLSDTLINEIDNVLGKGKYSLRTLRIGQTIKENFGAGAIINGDIIGQVGKCSLHRDIPAIFATPSYFRCKLHNYSKGAKLQLKKWLNEIRSNGEKVNAFDLFSIENRMGRWASQSGAVYHAIGQVSLNIFNSRSIIYTWTAVKRSERMKSLLHVDLIKNTTPALLDTPFGADESVVVKMSKSCGIFYLLASYVKFYVQKKQFIRKSVKYPQ